MKASIVTAIVAFIEEHDWYSLLEECGSIAQCEAEVAKTLSADPAAVVSYLDSFNGAAQYLIDSIEGGIA